MFDKLVANHRATLLRVVYVAVAVSLFLPVFGPHADILPGVLIGLVGMVLIPLVYYGVYFMFYIQIKNSYTSESALRRFCTMVTVLPVLFVLLADLLSLYNLVQGGPAVPPSTLVVGMPLAADRFWSKHIAESA